MTFDLATYLRRRQELINRTLLARVPAQAAPTEILWQAMNYSLAAGGKRLRPILTLTAWEACQSSPGVVIDPAVYPDVLLRVACALEMIHTYSLIHDDLPAMDNDDLRRGRPTNHKMFGEATAILAGDALLTEAFALMAEAETPHPPILLKVIGQIAAAAGVHGMAGGQALDLKAEGQQISAEALEALHRHKTGKLIHVACVVGGQLALASAAERAALDRYGEAIGLAFQIADDILDVEGGTDVLGKTAGSDAAHNKKTYPSVLGLPSSKARAQALIAEAVEATGIFKEQGKVLTSLAHYIIDRNH